MAHELIPFDHVKMQRVPLRSSDTFLIDEIGVTSGDWALASTLSSGEGHEGMIYKNEASERLIVAQYQHKGHSSDVPSLLREVCLILPEIDKTLDMSDNAWDGMSANVFKYSGKGARATAVVFEGGLVLAIATEKRFDVEMWDVIAVDFVSNIFGANSSRFCCALGVNTQSSMSTVMLTQSSHWSMFSMKCTPFESEVSCISSRGRGTLSLQTTECCKEDTFRTDLWIRSLNTTGSESEFLKSHDRVGCGASLERPRVGGRKALSITNCSFPGEVVVRPMYSRTTKEALLSQAASHQRIKKGQSTGPVRSLKETEFVIWLPRSLDFCFAADKDTSAIAPSILYPLRLHPSVGTVLMVSKRSPLSCSDCLVLQAANQTIKYTRLKDARSVGEYVDNLIHLNTLSGEWSVAVKAKGRLTMKPLGGSDSVSLQWWVRPSGCQNAGVVEVVQAVIRPEINAELIEEIVNFLLA